MKAVLTLGLLALVLGSFAAAQTVTYDFDRSVNFAAVKTYAWMQGADEKDDLNATRIMSAIDTQLAAKGMTRADSASKPDVLIDYRSTFSKALQIHGLGSFPLASRSARADDVLVGTLTVLMRNASSNALIWKGTATSDIDTGSSPEKRDKKINKAAEKMFKNYPPRK